MRSNIVRIHLREPLPPERLAITFTGRVRLGRTLASIVCGEVESYCKRNRCTLTYVLIRCGVTRTTFHRWKEHGVSLPQIPTALAMLDVIGKCLYVGDK